MRDGTRRRTCWNGSAVRRVVIESIERAMRWGQLLRTVYLCDSFTLPDFRRPLYRTRGIRPCLAAPNLYSTATREARPAHRGADRHVRRIDPAHQLRDGLEHPAVMAWN